MKKIKIKTDCSASKNYYDRNLFCTKEYLNRQGIRYLEKSQEDGFAFFSEHFLHGAMGDHIRTKKHKNGLLCGSYLIWLLIIQKNTGYYKLKNSDWKRENREDSAFVKFLLLAFMLGIFLKRGFRFFVIN